MGYPTKIQLIARKKGNQWYVNFPNALAEAMSFEKSEIVECVSGRFKVYHLRSLQSVPPRGSGLSRFQAFNNAELSAGTGAAPMSACMTLKDFILRPSGGL